MKTLPPQGSHFQTDIVGQDPQLNMDDLMPKFERPTLQKFGSVVDSIEVSSMPGLALIEQPILTKGHSLPPNFKVDDDKEPSNK